VQYRLGPASHSHLVWRPSHTHPATPLLHLCLSAVMWLPACTFKQLHISRTTPTPHAPPFPTACTGMGCTATPTGQCHFLPVSPRTACWAALLPCMPYLHSLTKCLLSGLVVAVCDIIVWLKLCLIYRYISFFDALLVHDMFCYKMAPAPPRIACLLPRSLPRYDAALLLPRRIRVLTFTRYATTLPAVLMPFACCRAA